MGLCAANLVGGGVVYAFGPNKTEKKGILEDKGPRGGSI
jgi:hypothetical protein